MPYGPGTYPPGDPRNWGVGLDALSPWQQTPGGTPPPGVAPVGPPQPPQPPGVAPFPAANRPMSLADLPASPPTSGEAAGLTPEQQMKARQIVMAGEGKEPAFQLGRSRAIPGLDR